MMWINTIINLASPVIRFVKNNAGKLWHEMPWILCACGAAMIGWMSHQLDSRNITISNMKQANAEASQHWQQQVLDIERDRQILASQVEQKYLEKEENAHSVTDRTISDLRANTLRLRRELAARDATNRLTARVTTASNHGQASTGLREPDAEFLVRFADSADSRVRQLNACQDYVEGLQNEKTVRAQNPHH